MTSSLSNIVNNSFEGVHRIECKSNLKKIIKNVKKVTKNVKIVELNICIGTVFLNIYIYIYLYIYILKMIE